MAIKHVNEFNTMEIRPWNKPRAKNEKDIVNPFIASRIPMGLNFLDIDHSKPLQIKAHIDNMTDTLMPAVHLDASGDTILYSAGCSWLDIVGESDRDFQWGPCGFYSGDKPTAEITFDRPFNRPPKVIVWIDELNLSEKKNWRLKAYAENVTKTGFTLCAPHTNDTTVLGIGTCWIACPDNRSHISIGNFNTADSGASCHGQQNSKSIKFDKKFDCAPRVFLALSGFDIDGGSNLRIKTYTKNVTASGMEVHIDTWGDTRMNSGIASYIAFQEY
ncbi:h-type lectin domain-containing protein [Ceratobasidium sp. AG-Ba]|nr:h-type lectin domain-containing protein [Ceratobasidium sp. AG-Ba]